MAAGEKLVLASVSFLYIYKGPSSASSTMTNIWGSVEKEDTKIYHWSLYKGNGNVASWLVSQCFSTGITKRGCSHRFLAESKIQLLTTCFRYSVTNLGRSTYPINRHIGRLLSAPGNREIYHSESLSTFFAVLCLHSLNWQGSNAIPAHIPS